MQLNSAAFAASRAAGSCCTALCRSVATTLPAWTRVTFGSECLILKVYRSTMISLFATFKVANKALEASAAAPSPELLTEHTELHLHLHFSLSWCCSSCQQPKRDIFALLARGHQLIMLFSKWRQGAINKGCGDELGDSSSSLPWNREGICGSTSHDAAVLAVLFLHAAMICLIQCRFRQFNLSRGWIGSRAKVAHVFVHVESKKPLYSESLTQSKGIKQWT